MDGGVNPLFVENGGPPGNNNNAGAAAAAVWRERERRARSLRTFFMILMMLLLMDGEEQNRNRAARSRAARAGIRSRNKGGRSSDDRIAVLEEGLLERRRTLDLALRETSKRSRGMERLVRSNGGRDLEGEVRDWATKDLERREKEWEELRKGAEGGSEDGRNDKGGGGASSANGDDDNDEAAEAAKEKVQHYPRNVTGFYRGGWERTPYLDDDDRGDDAAEARDAKERRPAATERRARPTEKKKRDGKDDDSLKVVDVVDVAPVMERRADEDGNGSAGVYLLPPGSTLEKEEEAATSATTKTTKDGSSKPGDGGKAKNEPSGSSSSNSVPTLPVPPPPADGKRPSVSLTQQSGRVAMHLFSRPVPGMTELSLVEGFVRLHDGRPSGVLPAAARSATDVLLRVRGVSIRSTGRVSLVANAVEGRAALVVPSSDGGRAVDDDDEKEREEEERTMERAKRSGQRLDSRNISRMLSTMPVHDVDALHPRDMLLSSDRAEDLRGWVNGEGPEPSASASASGLLERIRDDVLALHSFDDLPLGGEEGWTGALRSLDPPDGAERDEVGAAIAMFWPLWRDDGKSDVAGSGGNGSAPSLSQWLPSLSSFRFFERSRGDEEEESRAEHPSEGRRLGSAAEPDKEKKKKQKKTHKKKKVEKEHLRHDKNERIEAAARRSEGAGEDTKGDAGKRKPHEDSKSVVQDGAKAASAESRVGVGTPSAGKGGERGGGDGVVVVPYPYVPDDERRSVRKGIAPAALRRLPPRERSSESNAAGCEFELTFDVREEPWTVGRWRETASREEREIRAMERAAASSKRAGGTAGEDDVAGKAAATKGGDAEPGKKVEFSSREFASDGSDPAGASKPSNKRNDDDVVVSLTGRITSRNCRFSTTVNVTAIRTDWDKINSKAVNYGFFMMLTCLCQIVVLLRQLLHTQDPSAACRVSILCVGWQTVLDASICVIHVLLSLVLQPLFVAFASVAFFKLLIFGVIEMKYMAIILQARDRRDNVPDAAASLRRRVTAIHARLYAALFLTFVVGWNAIGANDDGLRRTLYLLALYSFWVPQIVRNVITESKRPTHPSYVYGISVSRLVMPLYFLGVPNNFLREADPDFASSGSSTFLTCQLLLAWVAIQAAILIGQGKYGARFMIPAIFLPPKYDYGRPIPASMLTLRRPASTDVEPGSDEVDNVGTAAVAAVGTDANTGVARNRIKGKGRSRSSDPRGGRGGMVADATIASAGSTVADDDDTISAGSNAVATLDCVICYDEVDARDPGGYMIAPCDHVFHRECLERWMDVKMECPVCRKELPAV